MKPRKKQGKRSLKKSKTTTLNGGKFISKNQIQQLNERNDAEESDGEDTDRPLKAADSTVDFDNDEQLMNDIIEESKQIDPSDSIKMIEPRDSDKTVLKAVQPNIPPNDSSSSFGDEIFIPNI